MQADDQTHPAWQDPKNMEQITPKPITADELDKAADLCERDPDKKLLPWYLRRIAARIRELEATVAEAEKWRVPEALTVERYGTPGGHGYAWPEDRGNLEGLWHWFKVDLDKPYWAAWTRDGYAPLSTCLEKLQAIAAAEIAAEAGVPREAAQEAAGGVVSTEAG